MKTLLDFIKSLFSTEGFPPRWNCGSAWREEPFWGWLHIVSDVAVWGAYAAIPFVLIRLVRGRSDTPFPRILYLFAAFILACGTTHLIEASIFYWPIYRIAGLMKLITAVVSWATVGALIYVVPTLMAFRSPGEANRLIDEKTRELSLLNTQLHKEVRLRNEANEELRASRELLQLALAANRTGYFNWDLQTNRVLLDRSESEIIGFGSGVSEILADEFFQRIDPEFVDEVRDATDEARRGSQPYDLRFPFIRPDGKRVWLSGTGLFIKNDAGVPVRMIGLNQDITDQIEREEELGDEAKRALEASTQKSRFVAQVSHEIRTPLTAMLGCIDTLIPEVEQHAVKSTLRMVRSQGELLRMLLNDVLDLSKIEAGKLSIAKEAFSLGGLIASVQSLMEPFAIQQGLFLHWEPETKLPLRIVSDPTRVKQILLNLTGNAIKFTRTGGVTLKARLEFEATQENAEGNLVLEIVDTGMGIAPQKIKRVFREFEQLQPGEAGTGLGLTISRKLARMLGGELSVASTLGSGSTFTLHLPVGPLRDLELVDASELPHVTADPVNDPVKLDTPLPIRVLAAEDTKSIQIVLQRMIEQHVALLTIVDDGQKAVDEVRRAELTDRPYDLVLMDMQMPVLDGIEATRQLRALGFARPIVALTAGAMDDERRESLAAGCSNFIAKPIDHRLLIDILVEASLPKAT